MAETAPTTELQLEAMRVTDCSWHPCRVSLSTSGSLVVHFEDLGSEEVILSEEQLFARIRVRSLPLQGDDCHHIGEGEHVLATSKLNSKSLFFDAVVEEVRLVRHSKRIICRCTFIIKWMHQDPDSENMTVPSSLIMKLSTESIRVHPVVAVFLNSVKNLSFSDGAPPTLDEPYVEYDVNGALEKQIEELGNLADVSTREPLEDIFVRVKPDSSKGDIKEAVVSHVRKLSIATNKGGPLRRSNRNVIKTKTEAKDLQPVIMSNLEESAENIFAKEESAENRSALNPLAARAALASLVSKLPEKLEFSFYREEKDIALQSNDTNHEPVGMELMNGTRLSSGLDSCSGNEIVNGLNSRATCISGFNSSNIVGSLMSASTDLSGNSQKTSRTTTAKKSKENLTCKVADMSVSLSCLTKDEKFPKPVRSARLTRSAVKNETANLMKDVHPGELDKDMIEKDFKSRKQLAFSEEKGEENLIGKSEIVLALRTDKLRQYAEPNSSRVNDFSPHARRSRNKEVNTEPESDEKHKRQKISSTVQTCQGSEGEGSHNDNSKMNQKRNDQPSQSSLQLNSCPRTRSRARS